MRETLIAALTEALQDEYKARATYQAICDRFGSVRPFVNILESEKTPHSGAVNPICPLPNRGARRLLARSCPGTGVLAASLQGGGAGRD